MAITCTCLDGYEDDVKIYVDVDECLNGDHNFHADFWPCNDLIGDFNCKCIDEYIGDSSVCNDFDECLNADGNNGDVEDWILCE